MIIVYVISTAPAACFGVYERTDLLICCTITNDNSSRPMPVRTESPLRGAALSAGGSVSLQINRLLLYTWYTHEMYVRTTGTRYVAYKYVLT